MSTENSHIADDSHSSWLAAREFRSNPDYPDDLPVHPDELEGHGVAVEQVFLDAKENAKKHHTEKYELVSEQNVAVLRRSTKFKLAIKTKSKSYLSGRPSRSYRDDIYLIFEFGKDGSLSKGTNVVVPVMNFLPKTIRNDFSNWKAYVHSQTGTTLVVEVHISASAPVGIWKLKVESRYLPLTRTCTPYRPSLFTHPEPIYILFNPYSIHDVVYMEKSKYRDEYVQNDVGKVWQGNYRRYHGKKWVFGQFDDSVLPACCFILQKSRIKASDRSNPVKVSRAISAMVNSNDDGGILFGNWSGSYGDGTNPQDWTGSIKIIEEYMENKGRRP